MNTINWKSKLASRKFWALVAALVVSVGTALGFEHEANKLVSVLTATGACVGYMLSEAVVDAGRTKSFEPIEEEEHANG